MSAIMRRAAVARLRAIPARDRTAWRRGRWAVVASPITHDFSLAALAAAGGLGGKHMAANVPASAGYFAAMCAAGRQARERTTAGRRA